MAEYEEPHLTERLDEALAKARRLIDNKIESLEDLNLAFRVVISDRYDIPLFDPYFADKTMDQLAFEAFFIRERQTTGAATASKVISDNQEEAAKAVEDQFAEFEELQKPSEAERKQWADFMDSGKFPGENP